MAVPAWLGAGLISGASALLTNAASARAARRQMEFQERMSSTAHQREVRDLRAAGINPMIRSLGGASTPGGAMPSLESPGEGAVGSALQARIMEAQLREISARTRLTEENATTVEVMRDPQLAVLHQTLSKLQTETDLTDAQRAEAIQRVQNFVPLMLDRAKAEVTSLLSSARAAQARALLDELAKAGAVNESQFNEAIGTGGPLVRFFVEMVRLIRTGGRR